MYIENLMNDKLKQVVFLELKKDTDVNGYTIKKDTPLPINLDNLVSGIKQNDYEDSIDLVEINKAIVFILGIDVDFKFREEYLEILKHTVKDEYKYIYSLAIIEKENGNNLNSYIYLNALNNICDETLESRFAEINVLEVLYDEYISELSDEDKNYILKRIITEYEKIVAEDNEYSPVYYRLGYVNRALNKFIKSKLYFEKFLAYSDNDLLKEEIREVLKELDDYAKIESIRTYLSYGKFNEAYKISQDVSGLYPVKDEVLYYLAICQYNLGYIEESIESLNKAIDINKEQEEYYNQLAINYVAIKQEEEAVRIYKEALFNIKDSYTINYNLGILLLNLNNEEYKKYLKKAYQLNANEDLLNLINL